MDRKRHLKLVNGISRAVGRMKEGAVQMRGRADSVKHITLSCYPQFPCFPWPDFSFFKRSRPEERIIQVDEKGSSQVKGGRGVRAA